MIKTILVPELNATSNSKALAMAAQVARLFDGHIELLHVHPDAAEMARYAASLNVEHAVFTGEVWQALQRADKARTASSQADCDQFAAKEKLVAASNVTTSWQEVSGNEVEQIILRAFCHDLVVFSRPEAPATLSTLSIGDVLVGCGHPLLLAPSKPCASLISSVVIAWKDAPASARAVSAAMPLLAKADKIVILEAVEDGDDAQAAINSTERLAAHLRCHGLKPQTGHVKFDHRDACQSIMEAAVKLHAGLVVMGGYSHSRARELIFGGFTRHVMREAPVPVFLCH